MPYICPLCSIDPLSHSLTKIKEINDIIYFYSCPSKAKLYFDTDGIINHYNGVLSEIPHNKKWIWIFDSNEFGMQHFVQLELAIELAKLISNKFSINLDKIIIINPTFYISSTYNIIYPFLTKKLRSIIDFNKKYKNVDDVLRIT